MSAEAWYVLAALLSPTGFVLQDVVADAMTVEAVPRAHADGRPVSEDERRLMNTTMQTLGRVALIGGLALVAAINLYMFADVARLSEAEKVAVYRRIYLTALAIPLISVAGIGLAAWLRRRELRRLLGQGVDPVQARAMLVPPIDRPAPNWWILGGGMGFVAFTLGVVAAPGGLDEEIVFVGSLAIVLFLIAKLTRALEPTARATLIGTATVIFVYRAVPLPGEGLTWWMIDVLGFDQRFLAVLSLVGSLLTLVGMVVFRRFIGTHSIVYVVGALTVLATLFSLPVLGLYHGLHQWTAARTGGMVDARFIVVVNTALESPLGQVAMIPMLAWIANSAPSSLKATYFAIMASFSNLSLSAGQLATKYLNQVFVITREVRDPAGAIVMPADYSQLGALLLVQLVLGLALPFLAIAVVRALRLRWA